MPYVRGFLRLGRRGHPDIGLPDPEAPVDPGYGVDEGGEVWPPPGAPDIGLPAPPPGIWPPLTPEHPWRPIPSLPERPSTGPVPTPPGVAPPIAPGGPGTPEHPITLPPGTIWPPLPPGVSGKFLVLVLIGGGGHGAHYRYAVIDAGLRPDQGLPPTAGPKA
jgi:hypothetical protein